MILWIKVLRMLVLRSRVWFVFYWRTIRFASFVFAMSFHVGIHTMRRHLLPSALRFFSSILTLCFLPSPMFFVGFIKLFLTLGKIFFYLMAFTLTQRVSTIYIVVTGAPFCGHSACFKIFFTHSLHFLNFHTFHSSIFVYMFNNF